MAEIGCSVSKRKHEIGQNLQSELQKVTYNKNENFQEHLTQVEEIFVEPAQLTNSVQEKDKIVALLCSLPNLFRFIALMAAADDMDCDYVVALIRLEIKRRQDHKRADQPLLAF